MGFNELPEEDRPPEEIWLDPEKLASHFEDVKERWKNQYGSGSGERVESAPMTENELAKEWRR